jgi:hypothetical protein
MLSLRKSWSSETRNLILFSKVGLLVLAIFLFPTLMFIRCFKEAWSTHAASKHPYLGLDTVTPSPPTPVNRSSMEDADSSDSEEEVIDPEDPEDVGYVEGKLRSTIPSLHNAFPPPSLFARSYPNISYG